MTRLWLKPIPVFVMHQVGESMNPMVDRKSDWSSFDLFKSNVDFIRNNYRIVSLPKACEMLKKQRMRFRKYAVLTFDDAYKSILPALEYLKEKDIPVTVFVNSAYLNGDKYSCVNVKTYLKYHNELVFSDDREQMIETIDDLRHCDSTIYRQRYDECLKCVEMDSVVQDLYIDREALFALDYTTLSIGMHGHEHLHSTNLADEQFRKNVMNNVDALRAHKRFVPFFAYPWGEHNQNTDAFLNNQGIAPVLCDGAVNYRFRGTMSRIPIDGKDLSKE